MQTSRSSRPRLLPVAALLSVLVLLLGVTGLFALRLTNDKSVAALERLGWFHSAQVTAVRVQVSFKTQVQEWKDVLLRGSNPKDYATYWGLFERREADVRAGLESLETDLARLGLDPATAGRLVTAHAALGAAYRKALADYRPAERDSAFAVDASIRGIDRKLNEDIDALAQSVNAAAESSLADFRHQGGERYATLRRITLGLGALAVLMAFWLVFLAARSSADLPTA